MEKAEKPPLARAITYFVSNANLIGEEVEQVIFDGCSILHLIYKIQAIVQAKSIPSTLFQILGVLVLFLIAI